jgi:acyl-CoA thioesterase-2
VTEPTLERMIALFDVEPEDGTPGRFIGHSEAEAGRPVVEGSQMLAQAIVAASKTFPGRTVRSAHAVFVSVGDPARPLELGVTTVQAGRSFATATIAVTQGDRTRVTATVLLDHPQPDLIRHDQWTGPPPGGPGQADPLPMPMRGRQVRAEGIRDINDPAEVGPPIVDAWLRYDTVPERDDLRRALIAHFTGPLSISTSMRPHAGVGTSQSHHTISTAPMAIGLTFHDPLEWSGWIRYHHESTFAGAGMSHVRGQVLTQDGRLIASFTQDAMIRALAPTGPAASKPAESRL